MTDTNNFKDPNFWHSPENQSQNNSIIPIKDIIIKERYRKEFGDIEGLADNINKIGLIVSITVTYNPVTKKYTLVDGQRRILAFEILGWTEIPCYIIDLEEIVVGEFSANTLRKDWTLSEMVAIKRAIEPYEKQKAKERELAGRPSEKFAQGKTREKVAGFVGVSHLTLKKAEDIVNAAELEPEKYQPLLDKIDSKKLSVDKAHNKLKKEKKREELKSVKTNIELPPENCKLFCNDFTKIDSKIIPDNSIHSIITDPPYGEQSLYLYEDLANLALRVLKPGGSIVFITGHIILDKVFAIFSKYPDLTYWWTIAVKHNGAKQRIHARSVFAEWKPLIWYVKGGKPNILDTIFDHIESSPPDKSFHEWAQSSEEVEHIIKYLTVENQIILDPMFGSGTTGIAALKLNRKFIGIEKNEETFNIAKNRIASSTVSTPFIKNNHLALSPIPGSDFSQSVMKNDGSCLAKEVSNSNC